MAEPLALPSTDAAGSKRKDPAHLSRGSTSGPLARGGSPDDNKKVICLSIKGYDPSHLP